MAAQRRALCRLYLTSILWIGGCSVYDSSLLGDRPASPSGGSGGEAGDAGSFAGKVGSAGTPADGGSSGAAGSGGSDGHAGEGASAGEMATGGEGGAVPCVPETPAEFCTRLGKDCGTVDGTDNCGNTVTGASCGTCSGLETCGGGDQPNVCGALTDPALGGTATASTVMFSHEDGSRAFDLDITTKWYAGDDNVTGWLAYQFAGTEQHVVKSYSVTSGNDVPQRDPAAWELQGSNNGVSWTMVDAQTSQLWSARRETLSYTCANTTAYRQYRLLVTANNGGSSLQISELVLYAN